MRGRQCTVFRGIGNQLVQYDSNRLCGSCGEQYLWALYARRAFPHAGCQFTANQFGEVHTFPVAAAEQSMSICQRLNSPIERLQEFVYRGAAFSRALSNGGDRSEDILDAVIKLADQHALAFLGALALGDVTGQPLDAQMAPSCIELRSACLFEPYLASVWTNKAEGRRIRPSLWAKPLDLSDEIMPILGMHMRQEV